jgi:putative ABC transport system permease protein
MWEAEVNGDAGTVNFLMIIAFIILIIAWVNYINLSTVKAIFRSKEVGIRKISGAFRFQLIIQFLIESFTINFIASLFAFFIVAVSNPYFSTLTTRNLHIGMPEIWQIFLAIILIGPLISGIYPALVISSFSPMAIFRGRLKGSSGGSQIRKILVVFQFAASIALISITLTVYNQVTFLRNQKLGIDISQTLVVKGPGVADSTYNEKLSAFKAELLKYPLIKAVTASTSIPGSKVNWNAGGIRLVSDDNSKSNQYRIIGIDYDFVDQYNLEVLAGRNFSNEFSTDAESVMFNEEAIKLMGLESPESAIGKEIYFWGSNYKIIGVIKNFHQESLKENFDALIFRFTPATRDYFSIKLNFINESGTDTENIMSKTLGIIKSDWDVRFPGNPFEYFILSEHYDNQYKAENQLRTIFELFSILAILIACLGLFGLSWFIIIQRTKEIGIRKVNGASVGELLLLISRDFFKLILLGIILAAPVAYLYSVKWLEKYPNRIEFSWWLFLLSGFLIFVISAITISYNTITIARTDPARSLKYE